MLSGTCESYKYSLVNIHTVPSRTLSYMVRFMLNKISLKYFIVSPRPPSIVNVTCSYLKCYCEFFILLCIFKSTCKCLKLL